MAHGIGNSYVYITIYQRCLITVHTYIYTLNENI